LSNFTIPDFILHLAGCQIISCICGVQILWRICKIKKFQTLNNMSLKSICLYIPPFIHNSLRFSYYSKQGSKHKGQIYFSHIHEVSFCSAYPVHVGWNTHTILLFPIWSCMRYRFTKVTSGWSQITSWKIRVFFILPDFLVLL
jgi:hypothetical protein